MNFSLAGSNLTDILEKSEKSRSKFSPVSTLWNGNQLDQLANGQLI